MRPEGGLPTNADVAAAPALILALTDVLWAGAREHIVHQVGEKMKVQPGRPGRIDGVADEFADELADALAEHGLTMAVLSEDPAARADTDAAHDAARILTALELVSASVELMKRVLEMAVAKAAATPTLTPEHSPPPARSGSAPRVVSLRLSSTPAAGVEGARAKAMLSSMMAVAEEEEQRQAAEAAAAAAEQRRHHATVAPSPSHSHRASSFNKSGDWREEVAAAARSRSAGLGGTGRSGGDSSRDALKQTLRNPLREAPRVPASHQTYADAVREDAPREDPSREELRAALRGSPTPSEAREHNGHSRVFGRAGILADKSPASRESPRGWLDAWLNPSTPAAKGPWGGRTGGGGSGGASVGGASLGGGSYAGGWVGGWGGKNGAPQTPTSGRGGSWEMRGQHERKGEHFMLTTPQYQQPNPPEVNRELTHISTSATYFGYAGAAKAAPMGGGFKPAGPRGTGYRLRDQVYV